MNLRTLSLWVALCLSSPLCVVASEPLLNGDFESSFYGTGVPTFWKANPGDGNSNLQDTIRLSPFTNVYPAGSNSVRLADGTSDSTSPNLFQTFLPSPAQFILSLDFYLDSVADAPWKFTVGSGANANLDFLISAANAFQYSGGTAGTVMTLSPDTWYQLSATIDDTAHTFSGLLTPFGSSPSSFSGLLFATGPATTSQVEIADFSANQNPTLYLDNVSVRTVPEPSVSAILFCGLTVLLILRLPLRSRRRGLIV